MESSGVEDTMWIQQRRIKRLQNTLALAIIYPLYFIIIASISDPDAVLGGDVILFPVGITFSGFEAILQRSDVWRGYLNTIIYTLLTVVLALIVNIPAGWALSRKRLFGKKFFMIYFIIPMFFGGGAVLRCGSVEQLFQCYDLPTR